MENKATIYKGEVMHDLKALFDNAGDYFEDEYELVKQYIEQLEQALDKATIAFPELLIKLMRIFYDSFIPITLTQQLKTLNIIKKST